MTPQTSDAAASTAPIRTLRCDAIAVKPSCHGLEHPPFVIGHRYQLAGIFLAADTRDGRRLAMRTLVAVELDRIEGPTWHCASPGVFINRPAFPSDESQIVASRCDYCAEDIAAWFNTRDALLSFAWPTDGDLEVFADVREGAPAPVRVMFCGAIVDLGPTPADETEESASGG